MWSQDRRAALSFAFDDARPSQVAVRSRTFDRLGVRPPSSCYPMAAQPYRRRWRRMVAAGHADRHHADVHAVQPTSGGSPRTTIEDLDRRYLAADIADADRWISEVLGVHPRTCAYPCGQTWVGRGVDGGELRPPDRRPVRGRALLQRHLGQLAPTLRPRPRHGVNSDDRSFSDLEPLLDATLEEGAWLVLGVPRDRRAACFETTTPALIEAVVGWCRRNAVWIDTIGTSPTTCGRRDPDPVDADVLRSCD